MSDSSTASGAVSDSPKVSKVSEAVIRIAGNSQDGIQSIGGFLARLAGRSEQEVMTFMTIPSTISGGPSIFQVRIGSGEVLSSGDEADVLLAFYQHSYENHIDFLKDGGVVLYDSAHVEPDPEMEKKYRHIGCPISELTVEAIGGTAKDKGKNIFALGLVSRMFDLDAAKLEKLITGRFKGKPSSITTTALTAFHAGYGYPLTTLAEIYEFEESTARDSEQVVCNGNEALGYGILAAGVRFGAGYPITPWSDIMELLRRELPKYDGVFVQAEDEIAAVSMAIGASWGGRCAVTGSSGPGIALKGEAIGWAVMAEIPLIIVNVQRGGPSTGMPTNVEQSDLNIACYGGHGDSPRVVIAPASVEDCFYTAIEAVNIARKYSTPVLILTDQAIATRIEAFGMPDLKNVCQDISPDLSPREDHKPYDLSAKDGITQHAPPGTYIKSGKYPVVTGLEHNEMGHPSGSPKMHLDMTAKRRSKLQALGRALPAPEVYGPEEGNVLLVGWGSTQGSLREATERARKAGDSVSALTIRHINPLPDGLENIFDGFNHVFVVENNDEGLYGFGQLCALLRAKYCDPKILGINKTDGLTWRVKDVLARVTEKMTELESK
ncbi:MAG TPA: 2-oxoacid:acceptor oxidoreductase subunit alpha [Verrucomicrobiales bacterium]|nr:2-oxoacid:acceptor oxidoreductase subunit alpha [Verrucomicrobiales bacterium]|tara:strand:+ start:145 stop:1965 length:1821 start_codon:yes stop_codon:yes gene_type:complete